MVEQITLGGTDDWKSARQRAGEKRAEAARKKAAIACAKKLEAAAEAVIAYLSACRECDDGSDDRIQGISDGRHQLIGSMMEYSCWLLGVYDKEGNHG